MRKSILAIFLIFIASSFVFTQQEAPAGAGDKSLADNDIKMRSVELDRIKREADKTAKLRREDGVELNFGIIKNDFEGIQMEQSEIIKAYQTGDKIDYKQINKSAAKITEMAIRLKSNVFLSEVVKDDSDKTETEEKSTDSKNKSIRNLIIDLDNEIGGFVTNSMFQNLQTIDPELSEKAQMNLDNIIELSGDLWLESNKMKSK